MLSENLKRIRQEKGMSIENLSKKTDVSMRTIEFLEWEKVKNPTLSTLVSLAKALGVTVNDLIE